MQRGYLYRLYKHFSVIVAVTGFIPFGSCKNENSSPANATAKDTTKAIELAIHTVLTEDFPDAPAMKKIAPFKDSIFFAAGTFAASLLPHRVDSFPVKVLPDTMICANMKRDTGIHVFPNYIRLADFENRDSGYFIKLESLNCLAGNEGGSVGVFIINTKDNFVFEKK
jgi:hypothetical protein